MKLKEKRFKKARIICTPIILFAGEFSIIFLCFRSVSAIHSDSCIRLFVALGLLVSMCIFFPVAIASLDEFNWFKQFAGSQVERAIVKARLGDLE